jgi:hypothetical protein
VCELFALRLVFVADVENALGGAGHEASEDHGFDHEMRQLGEDDAVLERARFALVGVTDDVLRRARFFADEVPLGAGRKPGAAHAAQAAVLQRLHDAFGRARL